jgi:hypothetical protein
MKIYSSAGLFLGQQKLQIYLKKKMIYFWRMNLNGQNAQV